MATTTARKIVRRRKTAVGLPLNVPVNVKVRGERAMRKSVVLGLHPSDPFQVVVHTGRRGRPAHLPVAKIEKFRVL